MKCAFCKASIIVFFLHFCLHTPVCGRAAEETLKIKGNTQLLFKFNALGGQFAEGSVSMNAPRFAQKMQEDFLTLRRRSVEFSAEENGVPPGLPPPTIGDRWFPSHDAPPTDLLPELHEFEQTLAASPLTNNEVLLHGKDLIGKKNQSQKLGNQSDLVAAFLEDDFTFDVEESEDGSDEELPSMMPKKPIRQRRDVRSKMEAKKRLAEILKQRQDIARQRGQTSAGPGKSTPRRSKNKRKQTQTGSQKRQPAKKPHQKKQSNGRQNQAAQTASKKPRKPTTGARRLRTTKQTLKTNPGGTGGVNQITTQSETAQPRRNSSNQNPVPQISENPKAVPKTAPQQRPTDPAVQRTLATSKPPNKQSQAPVSSNGNDQAPKRSVTKPKSARSDTVTVVKPILLTNGQRTTTTMQRQVSRVQHDLPQIKNKMPGITFSKWTGWNPCEASGCGAIGTQMRTRTCFGYELTEADYAICNYDSLVDQRACTAPPCSTPASEGSTTSENSSQLKKSSRWTPWSKCSVTCGTGGKQTRSKICYELADDGSEEIVSTDCPQETVESRHCQYSSSCPMWDSWSDWSLCSKTCGTGGVSFRDRKCVAERYVSFKQRGRNGDTQQFESATSNTRSTRREYGNADQKDAAKSAKRPKTAKPNQSRDGDLRGRGFTYLKNGERIFIVDAPRPRQDAPSAQKVVPEFHDDDSVNEIVDMRLCSELAGESEEEKNCAQESCPAEWSSWGTWSSCSKTCGMGISKKERHCRGASSSSTCVGRKYAYRRCYAPPCWTEWSKWGRCSISCGHSPGVKQRTRNCLGITAFIAEYNYCEGRETDKEQCLPDSCPGEKWSNWGPYEECSASCNGGYRRRTRTCRASKCSGPSEDFGRCNIHECPTWSNWSRYSCCTASCGEGIKRRTRSCVNGEIGQAGCDGENEHVEKCYKPPCGSAEHSVFENQRCGVGSVSNLKTIARLRIFGGTKSAAHRWPWMTSWQHRDSENSTWLHYCGATLLHPRWVITASHCTEESDHIVNHRDPGENWSVVIGMVKMCRDGTRYFLDRIFIHPKYEYKSVTKNDIALLKLRNMVPITNEVMPACMPKGRRPPPGEECYVTGWGYASTKSNALSLSLREAVMPIIRFHQCRTLGDYYRYFLDSNVHMCAGNPVTALADSCTGDSGGPLVCGRNGLWYLGAVTSFGFADCGTTGHVGIYAPMETYESWVGSTLQSHTYEAC